MAKLGLVFSGGGGKGAYEIGVWKALKEFGIDKEVKAISGTSVGGLNAAMFLQGDYEKAEQLWKTISQESILKINSKSISDKIESILGHLSINIGTIISNGFVNKFANRGFFSQNGLKRIIEANLQTSFITDSEKPIYVCVFNKQNSKPEYIKLNDKTPKDIVSYLLATSAIPFIFDHIIINGTEYFDGGIPIIGDNTPVTPVVKEGCDIIISVLLGQNKEMLGKELNYPNTKIAKIVPNDDQGGLKDGTLDFDPQRASKRIIEGYLDTKRIFEELYRWLLIENKIIKRVEEIGEQSKDFECLISENKLLREHFNISQQALTSNNNSLKFLLENGAVNNDHMVLYTERLENNLSDISQKIEESLKLSEKKILNDEIDNVLEEWKNNSDKIKQLAFEGITALSPIKPRIQYLSNQGLLKRIWNSITNKTNSLILENQSDLYKAVYVNQQIIKKLNERNLLTLDIVYSMGNRIEYLQKQIQMQNFKTEFIFEAINDIQVIIKDTIAAIQSKFENIDIRLNNLELQNNFNFWMHEITDKTFQSSIYINLDKNTKIALVISEFFKLTCGQKIIEKIATLKGALRKVGITENENIEIKDFLYNLNTNHNLMLNFLENVASNKNLFPIDSICKDNFPLLNGLEAARISHSHSAEDIIGIVNKNSYVNIDVSINAHNFAIELVYSLNEVYIQRKEDLKKVYEKILQECLEIESNKFSNKNFSDQITKLKDDIREYEVIVPLIGPFSAGKSTLLNSYLGKKILPYDTDAKTAVATELRYGNEELLNIFYLNGSKEEKTVDKLYLLEENCEKIIYSKLFLNNLKLKYNSDLVLVDMPGVDSNLENHTKSLLNYVQRGSFYIVVLHPAHQLEDSVINFIKEITTYKQKFAIIYTRADRFVCQQQEIISKTKLILKKITSDEVEVGFTDSKPEKVFDFDKIVTKIGENKNSFVQLYYYDKVSQKINEMLDYFNRMLKRGNTSVAAIDAELESVRKQIQLNNNSVADEIVKFQDNVQKNGTNRIAEKINSMLHSSIEVLKDAALGGNAALNARIVDLIRPIIVSGVREEVQREAIKVSERLNRIIDDSMLEISGNFNINAAPNQGGKGLLYTGSFVLFLINPILGLIAGILSIFKKSKSKDNEFKAQIINSVIPSVVEQSKASVKNCLQQSAAEVEKQLKEGVEKKNNLLIESLEEYKEKKQQSEDEFEASKNYWQSSVVRLNDLSKELEKSKI